MILPRRKFLLGLGSLIAAPAVLRLPLDFTPRGLILRPYLDLDYDEFLGSGGRQLLVGDELFTAMRESRRLASCRDRPLSVARSIE
jgi:hypothetical protein